MDPQTRDLMKVLKDGARDAATLENVENLLAEKRDALIASGDGTTLTEISELLERWAEKASDELAARALLPAAELALQAGDKEGAAAVYCGLGELRAKSLGDLNGGIEAFESALDAVASVDTIGRLADLFAQRAGEGDAEQAAELYYTLSDFAPKNEGIKYAERALDLIPGHDDALRFLERLIPEEQQAERLSGRWAAYLQVAQPGSAQDARRASLARVHASEGRFRDAVDVIAPLAEKGNSVAKQLKNVYLEKLQDEQGQNSVGSRTAENTQRSVTLKTTQAQREAGVSTLAENRATISTTEVDVQRETKARAEAEAEAEAARAEAAAEAEARAKAEAEAAQAILEADAIRADLQAEAEARAIAEAEIARVVEEREAAERAEAEAREKAEAEQWAVMKANAEIKAARAEAESARSRADQANQKASDAETARLEAEEARAKAEAARERAEAELRDSRRPRAAVVEAPPAPQLTIERDDPTPVLSTPPKSLDIDDDTNPIAIRSRRSSLPAFLLDRRVQIGGGAALALLVVIVAIAFGTSKPPAGKSTSETEEASAELEPTPSETESASAPKHLNPRVRTVSERLRIKGGELPKAKALSALNKRLPALKSCYRQALGRSPSLEGSLAYTVQVNTNGSVTKVKNIQGNIADKRLIQCGTEALKIARFTKPANRAARVKAVFYFRK